MWGTSVPGSVVSIKILKTPGFSMAAQPAVLLLTFSWYGGVGETQLPIDLLTNIHLPVMVSRVPALNAEDIKGGVKGPSCSGTSCHTSV